MMTKVLIVDDAKFMRLALSSIFTKNNFEVVGLAENGKEAVQMYKELKPDIVTLDITMPIMNGIEALKEIIKMDYDAKVVMCSAMGQQKQVVLAIEQGAQDFIVKPFNEEKVLKTVHHILSTNDTNEEEDISASSNDVKAVTDDVTKAEEEVVYEAPQLEKEEAKDKFKVDLSASQPFDFAALAKQRADKVDDLPEEKGVEMEEMVQSSEDQVAEVTSEVEAVVLDTVEEPIDVPVYKEPELTPGVEEEVVAEVEETMNVPVYKEPELAPEIEEEVLAEAGETINVPVYKEPELTSEVEEVDAEIEKTVDVPVYKEPELTPEVEEKVDAEVEDKIDVPVYKELELTPEVEEEVVAEVEDKIDVPVYKEPELTPEVEEEVVAEVEKTIDLPVYKEPELTPETEEYAEVAADESPAVSFSDIPVYKDSTMKEVEEDGAIEAGNSDKASDLTSMPAYNNNRLLNEMKEIRSLTESSLHNEKRIGFILEEEEAASIAVYEEADAQETAHTDVQTVTLNLLDYQGTPVYQSIIDKEMYDLEIDVPLHSISTISSEETKQVAYANFIDDSIIEETTTVPEQSSNVSEEDELVELIHELDEAPVHADIAPTEMELAVTEQVVDEHKENIEMTTSLSDSFDLDSISTLVDQIVSSANDDIEPVDELAADDDYDLDVVSSYLSDYLHSEKDELNNADAENESLQAVTDLLVDYINRPVTSMKRKHPTTSKVNDSKVVSLRRNQTSQGKNNYYNVYNSKPKTTNEQLNQQNNLHSSSYSSDYSKPFNLDQKTDKSNDY